MPETSIFTMPDGIQLFVQRYAPEGACRAWVLIVHGIAEHSGRYGHIVRHLNAHGFGVVTFDLRGHGRSSGPRIYVDHFDQYLDDTERIAQEIPAPFYLMGHSMGGLIAALAAHRLKDRMAGLILSSPALALPTPEWLQRMAAPLGKVAPKLPAAKLNRQYLSHDAYIVQQAKRDPLNYHGYVPARVGSELVRAGIYAREHAAALDMPLLLFHGTADLITDPQGTVALYEQSPSADKSLHLLDGLYHETFNEPERDQVLALFTEWLLARTGAPTESGRPPAL